MKNNVYIYPVSLSDPEKEIIRNHTEQTSPESYFSRKKKKKIWERFMNTFKWPFSEELPDSTQELCRTNAISHFLFDLSRTYSKRKISSDILLSKIFDNNMEPKEKYCLQCLMSIIFFFHNEFMFLYENKENSDASRGAKSGNKIKKKSEPHRKAYLELCKERKRKSIRSINEAFFKTYPYGEEPVTAKTLREWRNEAGICSKKKQ